MVNYYALTKNLKLKRIPNLTPWMTQDLDLSKT